MGERPTWPTHAEVAQSLIEQHAETRFSALVGTIQRYDPATQLADVVIGVRNPYQDPDGTGHLLREDFPVIPNVKVLFPRMGKWFIAMSVQPGDRVQLLFNTLSPSDWLYGDGRVVDVADTRRQHISHAVALIGMNINSEALQHVPLIRDPTDAEACLSIGSDIDDGMRLSIYGDGHLEIVKGDAVRLRIDADGTVHLAGAPAVTKLLALAELVDARLSTIRDAFNGHTHTVTGTANLTSGTVTGAAAAPSAMPVLASVAATKTRGV